MQDKTINNALRHLHLECMAVAESTFVTPHNRRCVKNNRFRQLIQNQPGGKPFQGSNPVPPSRECDAAVVAGAHVERPAEITLEMPLVGISALSAALQRMTGLSAEQTLTIRVAVQSQRMAA